MAIMSNRDPLTVFAEVMPYVGATLTVVMSVVGVLNMVGIVGNP